MIREQFTSSEEVEEEVDNWDGDVEEIEIAVIPPCTEELTDEENIDEEQILECGTLQGVTGTFELAGYKSPEVNEPAEKRLKCDPSLVPKWKKSDPVYKKEMSIPSKNAHDKLSILRRKSPVDIFEEFFTDELLSFIVEQTLYHAGQSNNSTFTLDINELKVFMGIILLSGYHKLPHQNMYWEQSSDTGVPLVYNAMTREKFKQIKHFLHLNTNTDIDRDDKMYKIKPYLDILRQNFLKFGIFDSHLSIGEIMIKYHGMNSSKIYVKGKPVKFGYKFWCLCSANGYLYNFLPYLGKDVDDEPLAMSVIKKLTAVIPPEESANHEIFFNDFFTSIDVLKALADRNLKATGAIRENRTKKCPLTSSSVIKETEERGFMEHSFDESNKVLITKWWDYAPACMATNYSSVSPIENVNRYSAKWKKDVSLPVPKVASDYNKFVGGVDVLDKQVGLYRTRIRGKKWWFPIFTQMLDVAVFNCWRIYNIVNKPEEISLLEVRRRIVLCYISKRYPSDRKRCGPQRSGLLKGRVSEDVRYDPGNHFVRVIPTQRRCANCGKKTKKMCSRCDVPLHDICFEGFHTV